jgi:two-component system response regulator AtoC
LRERIDDLAELAAHFLRQLGRADTTLEPQLLATLRGYAWPGNVRELRNILERAHILAGRDPIRAEHLVLPAARASLAAGALGEEPLDLHIERHEKRLIEIALRRAGGNKTRAAEMLGLTRRALYSRMERLGVPLEGA